MTVSGTRTFIRTRDQLISNVLRKLRVINENQTPSTNQYTIASEALNIMVQHWQNRSVFLWSVLEDLFMITADTPTITLDVDMIEVFNVCFSENDSDTPLTKLTREEYMAISDKRATGIPKSYYVDYQLAQPTMYLHPVWDETSGVVDGTDALVYQCISDHTSAAATKPITGADYLDEWRATTFITAATAPAWVTATDYESGIIKLDKLLRLQDFAATGDNPDFPVRFYKACLYGLCVDLAPEFGKSEDAYIKKAERYLDEAIGGAKETGDLIVSPRRS